MIVVQMSTFSLTVSGDIFKQFVMRDLPVGITAGEVLDLLCLQGASSGQFRLIDSDGLLDADEPVRGAKVTVIEMENWKNTRSFVPPILFWALHIIAFVMWYFKANLMKLSVFYFVGVMILYFSGQFYDIDNLTIFRSSVQSHITLSLGFEFVKMFLPWYDYEDLPPKPAY